jgi:hypothetical protein
MKIIAHEHRIGVREEDNIAGRNFPLKIDRTLRQYQPRKKWKKSDESLRPRDAHKPNTGISQQGLNERRIRREAENRGIGPAIIECVDGGLTCKR